MMNDEYDKSFISLITIHFDNKLINFIDVVKSYLYIDLETEDFCILQQSQKSLFKAFVKFQHLLTFNEPTEKITYKSHRNNFALAIAYISNLQIINSWDDLLGQITWKYKFHTFNFDDFTQEYKCCCQHLCCPANQYLVINNLTDLLLTVGCDCIDKTGLVNPEDLKDLKKLRYQNISFVQYEIDRLEVKLKKREIKKRLDILKTKIQTRNQNKRLWKVIRYIYNTLKDKMYFPKVINQFPNISYYRFIKYAYTKNKTYWIKTIDWYISDDSKISIHVKNKIKKIRNIFLK
jgi:hypothetical protein